MNARDLRFGIEIECNIPRNYINESEIGGYHHGIQLYDAPQGWNAQRDGSVEAFDSNMVAVEIVSPILQGEDGLIQVVYMIDYLNSIGATVNNSCGLHVHVGGEAIDRQTLDDLRDLFTTFEKAFFGLNGRQASNRYHSDYCVPSHKWCDSRRQSLNTTNMVLQRKKTVEIRCFAGSLNAAIVVSAVYMCVSIVARAINGKLATHNFRTCHAAMMAFINETFSEPEYNIVPDEDAADLVATMLTQSRIARLTV